MALGPTPFAARKFPGTSVLLRRTSVSATKGPVESSGASPLPPARVRSGMPAPVRATETRGDGPDTATAAANVPMRISPTPTSASRRLTAIAPQPPESIKERQTRIDTFRDKPIIPQERALAQLQGGIRGGQSDGDRETLYAHK